MANNEVRAERPRRAKSPPSEAVASGSGAEAVIRQAALDLFVERGYHGTSLRDIADRAGTNVSHLYYYFPSKAHVLRSMMTLGIQDLLVALGQAVQLAGEGPVARMSAIVQAQVLFHCQRQAEAFIGRSELRSLSEEDRPQVVGLYDQVTAMFNDVVADGVRQRVFHCQHRTEATLAILSMCYGVTNWYHKDGRLTPQTIARRYAELSLKMLGAGDL